MRIYSILKRQFSEGDSRTINAKKNIVISFILQGLSILVSFILVPLTLGYLSNFEYGIWLTLSSILLWINYFDIGLGNGLRNILAESLAKDNKELSQIYVSTTFYTLTILMFVIFVVFLIAQSFLNWYQILNVSVDKISNLNSVVTFVFGFFCLSFVLKFIGNVYLALQRPALNSLVTFLGQFLSLILIYLLVQISSKGSLEYVAIIYSATPALVLLIAYPITFRSKYKFLKPQIKCFKIKYIRQLMSLGIKFFFLQIAGLVIFSTSNIIISQILSPAEVTPFNIANKYFSLITMVFGIIISPMWSASTDAYVKGDVLWIKNTVTKLMNILAVIAVLVVIMILLSNKIYYLWVGDKVHVPILLTILSGIYSIILSWSLCFSNFIFGIGKLKLQLYSTIVVSVLFIPLSLWLCNRLGVSGIVLSLCLVNIVSCILNPIQFYKILNNKANGIWNE